MSRRPAATLLLAAGGGLLAVAGFAPLRWFPLLFVSLALLFRLWRAAPTPRTAAWQGFAWGLGCFLGGVSWVYVSLHDFAGLPAPAAAAATLAFCAVLALYPAAAGWLFARHRRLTTADSFLFAGLWTLFEWLRGTLFTGFPWLAVGYAQSPPSPLAGYAGVLGVYGVGLVSALLAASLAQNQARWRGWTLALLLLGGGQVLRHMDWTPPVGAPLKVALLQGNVPQSLKWDPQRLPLSVDTYLRLAARNPAPLTVLPETALPMFFDEVPPEVTRALTANGDALLGVAVALRDGGYTNGAVALKTDGRPSAYAKRHLVPFGEYAPPGFAWFFRFARIPMADFSAGPAQQPPLAVGGQRIAPSICYEDLFGEEVLDALPAATLLVNQSNTAWFGDSLAQPQHLQIAQMRAMETGRSMLRATNTGMTAMVTPDGHIAAALPPFLPAALVVEAQGRSGLTPYARWGNTLALLLAVLACVPAWRRRRAQSA